MKAHILLLFLIGLLISTTGKSQTLAGPTGSQSLYPPNVGAIKKDLKRDLDAYGISCLDVGIAKDGCLWVYVLDNGKKWDGVAHILCYRAQMYTIDCVTILDRHQHPLGRSQCK